MRRPVALLVAASACVACGFTSSRNNKPTFGFELCVATPPPPGGISVEETEAPADEDAPSSDASMKRVGINSRGAKMNEVDFTLEPTDVSLSRCYQMNPSEDSANLEQPSQILSLRRSLNTASNRAVRRILLARSWPSAEALNLSLRTVLMQQELQKDEEVQGSSDKKCPVPRPVLNIIMNKRGDSLVVPDVNTPAPRTTEEREQVWIQNQLAVFNESYSELPGYVDAEAYLESVLSLATSGEESDRVEEVLSGAYSEAYNRIVSVIQSVGAVLEGPPDSSRRRIAKNLIDQDICLSMIDKITMSNERKVLEAESNAQEKTASAVSIPYNAAALLAYDRSDKSVPFEKFQEQYVTDAVAMVIAKKMAREKVETIAAQDSEADESKSVNKDGRKRRRFMFWRKDTGSNSDSMANETSAIEIQLDDDDAGELSEPDEITIEPDDLGGVLLSAEEPTMTRQLNVLSNIVQRTLIFGGDQELLVLAETMDADKPAFIQRWYSGDSAEVADTMNETRSGVQYLNSLIQLLRDCYTKGVLRNVEPTLPLSSGYKNSYSRLTASLIELGSGYVRPSTSSSLSLALTTTAATAQYLSSTTPPKSAREELNRFAQWESTVRKNRANPYPDDLVGIWTVEDIVGFQTVGTSEVVFEPQGKLTVKPPLQGLRWRLDAGPTHLDTCTFQVLSDDGAILQYKGFVDRGSRLEARVSKRSVSMRGGVSFLMRDADGSVDGDTTFYDDMVPLNYKSGQTKFYMKRKKGSGTSLSSSSAGSTL